MSSTDFTNDDRFDGLYLNVAQTARGIEPLLDTVFSFLRRKTDFFHGPSGQGTDQAIQKVNEVLQKHVGIYNKEMEQKLKLEEQKRIKKAKDEHREKVNNATINTDGDDVIEIGADGGFDVSDGANNSKSDIKNQNDIPHSIEAQDPKSTNQDEIESKNTTDDNDEDDGPPPVGNGGTVEGKYVWTQTLSELSVVVSVPPNTRGRDVNIIISKKHLKIGLKSQGPNTFIVNAPLSKTIICDDSFWTIEDGNRIVINLQKQNQMEWWSCVCEGDPTIDVKKVQPENSKLDDLDGETRQTVEKMMFDQRQKALGLPTSEEQHKFEMLEKFKKAHPEMDFSNAKIS